MTEIWTPLSLRHGVDEALRDHLSAALATALREWIAEAAGSSAGRCERVLLRCDLARDPEHGPDDDVDNIEFLAWWTPNEVLLDVVDAILDLLPTAIAPVRRTLNGQVREPSVFDITAYNMAVLKASRHREPLQLLLDDGRSVYTIRRDGRALVRRVDPTVTALLDAASRAAEQPERGSASAHLKRAYIAAYALHADPVRAYSEAIKAVEAAAHATLEPNNTKATLGTMLRELRQHPGRWEVTLAGKSGTEGAATVEAMMSLLWTGQTSRHGNLQATREESPDEARMAVDLAGALVRWFAAGVVRRR
ncbi:hypothetical protein [Streptomyces sp. NPDC059597]|uniref:hypothetical protein n=1 Tax=Streptomyces sp. NPDC059597 TaxID=3346879 RepID=UPI003685823D